MKKNTWKNMSLMTILLLFLISLRFRLASFIFFSFWISVISCLPWEVSYIISYWFLASRKLLIIRKQEMTDGRITRNDISKLKLCEVAIMANPAIIMPFTAIRDVQSAKLIWMVISVNRLCSFSIFIKLKNKYLFHLMYPYMRSAAVLIRTYVIIAYIL